MKVLLLNQTFFPDPVATAQQITDLAEFLVQNGCQVSVVAGRRGYERRDEIHKEREEYRGIQVYRVGSTGYGRRSVFHRFIDAISFDLALVWRLFLLERHDVVVSFTSPPLIGTVGAVLAFFWRAKSVQWLMDINPDIAIAVGYLRPKGLRATFLTACLRFSLRISQDIIVLDRWMKKKVEAHGVSRAKVHILPPWPVHEYDVDPAHLPPKENNFRNELGLSGKFVVLYSGNHSVVHPLNSLLEVARELRDDPDIRFVFIGGGLRVRDVTRFKEFHGLTNIIQLAHQPREKLKETLSFADLHVVVMGNEVNGLVHVSKIYGVLATGRPYVFIGPRQSHVGDLINECPYGMTVEHGDEAGLIRVIRSTMKLGAEELREIARNNLAYVAAHQRQQGGAKARFLTEVLGCELAAAPTSTTRAAV